MASNKSANDLNLEGEANHKFRATETGKVVSNVCSEHAFHVDHDKALDRWDVVDEEGRVIGFCRDQGEAIDYAIREAQHRHGHGDDVVVCVQRPDGHYSLAWSAM